MLARRTLIRAVVLGLPAAALLAACKNRERGEYESGESEEYSRPEGRDTDSSGGAGDGGGGMGGGY